MEFTNSDELIQAYLSGESVRSIAARIGVADGSLMTWLKSKGVQTRTRSSNGLYRKSKVHDTIDDLIRSYLSGTPLHAVAARAHISHNTLRREFVRKGVPLRTMSEAETLKWSMMPPDKRTSQVQAAHRSTLGRKKTVPHKTNVARRVYECRARIRPIEDQIAAALRTLEVPIRQQYPIGIYNVDIALYGHPVAVEVERGRYAAGKSLRGFRERLKYILDEGWAVLFIFGKELDPIITAGEIVSWFQIASADESVLGKYGMIDRTTKKRPRKSLKFEGFPRVDGF